MVSSKDFVASTALTSRSLQVSSYSGTPAANSNGKTNGSPQKLGDHDGSENAAAVVKLSPATKQSAGRKLRDTQQIHQLRY